MNIIEKAYIELEEESIKSTKNHNLSLIFQNARDLLTKNGDFEKAKKMQYEIDFLNFRIEENVLLPLFSGTNDKGERCEYPSLTVFTKETYDYLIEREKQVKSQKLKAIYSHILWLSPEKEFKYAKTAIENYLELSKIREKQDIEFPNEYFGLDVLNSVKNAFLLSVSTKYEVEKIKNYIIKLIKEYSEESQSVITIKLQLIRLMIEQKNIFKAQNFDGIVEICEQIIQKNHSNDKFLIIEILNLIIKIVQKLKKSIVKYEERIAEVWEELSVDREDKSNLVSSEFCKNALTIYKKLKKTDKISELEKRYEILRKSINLPLIEHKVDLTELMNEFRRIAEELTNHSTNTIINYLMRDQNILPTYDSVKEQAEETNKNSFLSYIANTSILDRNGNTSQYFSTEEEYEYFKILESYKFSIEITRIHLIREIIFAGIKKGKLNTREFLLFLQKNSWLGKELELSLDGQKVDSYCWLALIAPALNEYFINLEYYLKNPNNISNFILCIDSLSLKIEGMLRDICIFNKITTFELKSDKEGRTISVEKDIHKLLYDPELTKIINKDDLLFFKFLLVEKAGYNLRHRVAHSLMKYNDYHIDLMNLLLIAILRFGKYDFVRNNI